MRLSDGNDVFMATQLESDRLDLNHVLLTPELKGHLTRSHVVNVVVKVF